MKRESEEKKWKQDEENNKKKRRHKAEWVLGKYERLMKQEVRARRKDGPKQRYRGIKENEDKRVK